jgi:hypothetical protein
MHIRGLKQEYSAVEQLIKMLKYKDPAFTPFSDRVTTPTTNQLKQKPAKAPAFHASGQAGESTACTRHGKPDGALSAACSGTPSLIPF